MSLLNDSSVNQVARDFTAKAIEHGLISKGESAKETAESIVTFYQTIHDQINNFPKD